MSDEKPKMGPFEARVKEELAEFVADDIEAPVSDDKHDVVIHCTGCGQKLALDAPVAIKATPRAWPLEAEGNYPMTCTFDEYLGRVSALVKAATAVTQAYFRPSDEVERRMDALREALKPFEGP